MLGVHHGVLVTLASSRTSRRTLVYEMKKLMILAGLLTFASCVTVAPPTQTYFPATAVFGHGGQPGSISDWHIESLAGMNEPSLMDEAASDKSAQVYRLTWLRSFHDPMIFRIVLQTNVQARLTVKKLSLIREDGSGYIPISERKLLMDRTRKLGSTEIKNMFAFLEASEFWERPYIDPYIDKMGTDGSTWIFEGVDKGRHHFTRRWHPLPNPVERVSTAAENGTPIEELVENPIISRQKSIQEAGLDSLCLYVLLLGGASTEEIY